MYVCVCVCCGRARLRRARELMLLFPTGLAKWNNSLFNGLLAPVVSYPLRPLRVFVPTGGLSGLFFVRCIVFSSFYHYIIYIPQCFSAIFTLSTF